MIRVSLLLAAPAFIPFPAAQGISEASSSAQERDQDVKLPSGKSQKEEILKAEHQKTLQDAAELARLSGELQSDIEKNDYHVLSIATLKKAERIEKLARQIKSRLRR